VTLERAELARMIDHTLLAPEATPATVEALCAEAIDLGVFAVCVSPTMVPVAVRAVDGRLPVAAVVGFPSGAHRAEVKAIEARLAVADGAAEIDLVVDLGAVVSGDWATVAAEIDAVRDEVDGLLKVILEAAVLEPEVLERAARTAVAAGADLLKTSTGFHPAGGASIDTVSLLAGVAATSGPAPCGQPVGVKAAGGIRDRATAEAMVDAGATRLGCSSSRVVLGEVG
jgi:deoxyribose-phosphate aldolase